MCLYAVTSRITDNWAEIRGISHVYLLSGYFPQSCTAASEHVWTYVTCTWRRKVSYKWVSNAYMRLKCILGNGRIWIVLGLKYNAILSNNLFGALATKQKLTKEVASSCSCKLRLAQSDYYQKENWLSHWKCSLENLI